MRFVTKVPPISNFDSKCHIKKLKSSKTCLIGYSGFISHEWFLIAWGADTHTRTHTHTDFAYENNFKKPGQRSVRAWFKNFFTDYSNAMYQYPNYIVKICISVFLIIKYNI